MRGEPRRLELDGHVAILRLDGHVAILRCLEVRVYFAGTYNDNTEKFVRQMKVSPHEDDTLFTYMGWTAPDSRIIADAVSDLRASIPRWVRGG